MYLGTFFSWVAIFNGHFDHFHGLHGHENTHHLIGHQTSFHLLFYSKKKLHWFGRYWDFKIMDPFSGYHCRFKYTRKIVRIMICMTRSTREIFWSSLIVLNLWNLEWGFLNDILRCNRLDFFQFPLQSSVIKMNSTLMWISKPQILTSRPRKLGK
jgi:hypothetical protein